MWDLEAVKKLGNEVTDILDKNHLSVTKIEENNGLKINMSMESSTRAIKDYDFVVECEKVEDFVKEFKTFSDNFDVDEAVKNHLKDGKETLNEYFKHYNAVNECLKNTSNELETAVKSQELTQEDKMNYMVLSRLKLDCEGYLDTGIPHFQQPTLKEQFGEMRRIYDILPVKPEWFTTPEQINALEKSVYKMAEERTKDWMKDDLEVLTNKERKCVITPEDNNDRMSETTLLSYFSEYRKSDEKSEIKFKDFLTEKAKEFFDNEGIEEPEKMLEVLERMDERVKEENPVIKETYFRLKEEINSPYEFLLEAGYQGMDVKIEEFLDKDYSVNMMFSTEREENSDMGAINMYFDMEIDEEFREKYKDNALTYLVEQQGYKIEDVRDEYNGEKSGNKFLKSAAEEVDNLNYSMRELTVAINSKGENLINLLESIAKEEGYISLSKDTTIGLYNEWQGAMSQMEIQLEKELVFPSSMVRNTQIEKAEGNEGYTLGLTSDQRSGEVTIKDEMTEVKEKKKNKQVER